MMNLIKDLNVVMDKEEIIRIMEVEVKADKSNEVKVEVVVNSAEVVVEVIVMILQEKKLIGTKNTRPRTL